MPLTVKHSKVSPVADGPDSNLVRPSDWNADHQITGLDSITDPVAVSVNSTSPAMKITQTGTGNALVVEDAASDTTLFVIDSSGNVGIGTAGSPTVTLEVNATDAIKLPVGTTAQRPGSPAQGMFRRNSQLGQWEGYNGTSWDVIPDTSGVATLTGTQTLQNKTLDSTNNVSGASGHLAGFRNKIINGGFTVSQRGNQILTSTPTFFADRWIGYILSGTSVSGTLGSALWGSGFDSAYVGYITGTWTTGTPVFRTRIESLNSMSLDGKSVTLSLQLLHDLGASQDFYVRVYKANSADNFAATTQIGSGTATIPNETITKYSLTFSISAGNALNGLEIQIFTPAAISATSKFIYLGSVQLEFGSIATPFEQRPIGLELVLCQRYYYFQQATGVGVAALAGDGFGIRFPVSMRAAPTISGLFNALAGPAGTFSAINVSQEGFTAYNSSANWTVGAGIVAQFSATSEL